MALLTAELFDFVRNVFSYRYYTRLDTYGSLDQCIFTQTAGQLRAVDKIISFFSFLSLSNFLGTTREFSTFHLSFGTIAAFGLNLITIFVSTIVISYLFAMRIFVVVYVLIY